MTKQVKHTELPWDVSFDNYGDGGWKYNAIVSHDMEEA